MNPLVVRLAASLFAIAGLVLGCIMAVAAAPLPDIVDVALDPGHSTWDVGAIGSGLREHEVTLAVAQQARGRLQALGYRVRLTRENPGPVASVLPPYSTEAIRLEQEARHTVAGAARAYVSVHFNGHPNRSLRGTETYFNSDNFGEESRLLAESVHGQLLAALSAVGYTPVDRGVREDLTAGKPYGHFFSLRGPFPSALVEALFLSNAQDAAILHNEAIRGAIAEGITRGIATYLDGEAADR